MRMPPLPPRRPAVEVGPGERVLAWAEVADPDGPDAAGPAVVAKGVVVGTREALYLPAPEDTSPLRIAWEQVATADWDADAERLRVVELVDFGQSQPVHVVRLERAGRLLQLLRERVSASICLQRHVSVGESSVRVVARRAPSGRGAIAWFVDYDADLDPAAPDVVAVVDAALAVARSDVGVG